LNLLIAEVAYAISNQPKTIIQMQQPIIDLDLAESSLVHRGESSISGWYPSLMGALMVFAKKTFKFWKDNVDIGLC
jgi:hypothetical protein